MVFLGVYLPRSDEQWPCEAEARWPIEHGLRSNLCCTGISVLHCAKGAVPMTGNLVL